MHCWGQNIIARDFIYYRQPITLYFIVQRRYRRLIDRTCKMGRKTAGFGVVRPITRSVTRGVASAERSGRKARTCQTRMSRREISSETNINVLSRDLHRRLSGAATASFQQWMNAYMRGAIAVRGVRSADTVRVSKEWMRDNEKALQGVETVDMMKGLLKGDYAEDKCAGGCYLDGLAKDRLDIELLASISELFDEGHIYSWGVVDSFSMRALKRFVKVHGEEAVDIIHGWHSAENLWRARASLVGLLSVTGEVKYRERFWIGCEGLIKRPERFAKTAVGWVLRDMWKTKEGEKFVREFLEEFKESMSLEAAKNASKYCEEEEKKKLLERVKEYSKALNPKE